MTSKRASNNRSATVQAIQPVYAPGEVEEPGEAVGCGAGSSSKLGEEDAGAALIETGLRPIGSTLCILDTQLDLAEHGALHMDFAADLRMLLLALLSCAAVLKLARRSSAAKIRREPVGL